MLRAQQEMLSTTKATKPAKAARTAAPKVPAKTKAAKDARSKDDAPAPKQREGTRKATVVALLEREGGATLEEIMAETKWLKLSPRLYLHAGQQARLQRREHAPRGGQGEGLHD
jgi:hypothetical protein